MLMKTCSAALIVSSQQQVELDGKSPEITVSSLEKTRSAKRQVSTFKAATRVRTVSRIRFCQSWQLEEARWSRVFLALRRAQLREMGIHLLVPFQIPDGAVGEY